MTCRFVILNQEALDIIRDFGKWEDGEMKGSRGNGEPGEIGNKGD